MMVTVLLEVDGDGVVYQGDGVVYQGDGGVGM